MRLRELLHVCRFPDDEVVIWRIEDLLPNHCAFVLLSLLRGEGASKRLAKNFLRETAANSSSFLAYNNYSAPAYQSGLPIVTGCYGTHPFLHPWPVLTFLTYTHNSSYDTYVRPPITPIYTLYLVHKVSFSLFKCLYINYL